VNNELDKLNIPNFNSYSIYTTSYLGYGNDQARIAIVSKSLTANSNIITTPCYHQGYSGVWEVDNSKTV
jgi:apyrase